MSNNYFISGEFNLICDSCGKKMKAHEAKHRWDGLIVCKDDYEQRHPQDFVKARQDKISVPFSRPRPPDVFTDVVYMCTVEGKSAIPNRAIAGCMIAGHREGSIIFLNDSAVAGHLIPGSAVANRGYTIG